MVLPTPTLQYSVNNFNNDPFLVITYYIHRIAN